MKFITKFYNHLINDSLYRNSIYLMLSTAVTAAFGFFFWIINARLFTSVQVGIATALISVLSLISSVSLLGLNNGIIRYLATSDRKNHIINTAFTVVGSASVLLALVYLIFINLFSPKLLFVRENIFFSLLFILVTVFASLNTIAESVFIAYRSAKYILIKNTIFSIVKLALPIFLISLGAYGIFASVGIAFIVGFLLGLTFLIVKFNYLIRPAITKDVVKMMTRFSLENYTAGLIGGMPAVVLPIIILDSLGPKFSAYFYMAMNIAGLLYIIPNAVTQSLFAEGSHTEENLKKFIQKAMKMNFLILIPAIIVTLLLGKYVLLVFGSEYSAQGSILLQLLALSGIFLFINYTGSAIFYIKHRVKLVILVNLIGTVIILSLSYLLSRQNLLGIGIAWIIGQAVISVIYLFIIWKNKILRETG